MTPVAAIFGGACIYLLIWLRHDNIRIGLGEWDPPPLLRRVLRRGKGPVYASALAFEAWGLSMMIVGLLAQAGALSGSLETSLLNATLFGAIPLWIICAGLFLAKRVRRLGRDS